MAWDAAEQGKIPPSTPEMCCAQPAPRTDCTGENTPGRPGKQHMDVAFAGSTEHPTQHPPQAQSPGMDGSILQQHFLPLPSPTAAFHQLINSARFSPRSRGSAIDSLRCIVLCVDGELREILCSAPAASPALLMSRSMRNGVTAPLECLVLPGWRC